MHLQATNPSGAVAFLRSHEYRWDSQQWPGRRSAMRHLLVGMVSARVASMALLLTASGTHYGVVMSAAAQSAPSVSGGLKERIVFVRADPAPRNCIHGVHHQRGPGGKHQWHTAAPRFEATSAAGVRRNEIASRIGMVRERSSYTSTALIRRCRPAL